MKAVVARALGLVGVLCLASTALAQTPPATQNAAPVIEEVVITGSRIAGPNLTATSPIQVVSSKDIQTSGKTDINDIILQLPQNYDSGLGQDLGNRTSGLTTAGGVSTVDLRGLGPNRTLVLVNGRRLGIGSPYTAIQSPAPDVDQIASRLIERVEVVTGGASAVYGSDAFAGVEFEASSGFNWHNNDSALPQSYATARGYRFPTGSISDGRATNYSLIA